MVAKKKPRSRKGIGGRPSLMTEATVRKLEEAFLLGCTDREAAFAAGIAPSTLYKYCEDHPEFLERKETLKKRPVFMARKVVVNALENNDIGTAHRVLERHDGTKALVDVPEGGPLESLLKEISGRVHGPKT
jgi:hypothetical protein